MVQYYICSVTYASALEAHGQATAYVDGANTVKSHLGEDCEAAGAGEDAAAVHRLR